MNKYQQSYEYIEGFIKLYPTHKLDEEHLANIKELVDQTKTLTLEELLKEWEKLGYEIYQKRTHITMINNKEQTEIAICFKSKCYFKSERIYNDYALITYQEHKLLSKTLEALGWE